MRFLLLTLLALASQVGRAQGVAAGYKLSPMDKISVVVMQDPVSGRPIELSVSPLGDLAVPVSRCCEDSVIVNVNGKTVEQAEKELAQKLESDFYQKATVQIRVIDPTRRKGQVLLQGAVRAHSYLLDSGRTRTLWEVLTEVGVTEYGNLKKVKLDRGGKITEHDVDAVNKGDRTKDIEIQDGDRITVVEKIFNLR